MPCFLKKGSDGSAAIYDRETGTRWNIEGKGEEGPLAGKSLLRLPNHLSQWYGWVAYFPQTTIYGRADPPQTITPIDPLAKNSVAPPPDKPWDGKSDPSYVIIGVLARRGR